MKMKLTNMDMYYDVVGEGRPMILIHGNGEDHHVFDLLSQQLKTAYQLYLVDSRNHGKSSQTQVYDYQIMAEDMHQFITKLNMHQPIIFGFSDGGIIGLILASLYPSLLSKLIVAGANLYPKGIKRKALLGIELEYEQTKNPLLQMMLNAPNITHKDLRKIEVPTLILAGEHDVITLRHTKMIQRHIKDSQCIIMLGHSHDSYIINSKQLQHILLQF